MKPFLLISFLLLFTSCWSQPAIKMDSNKDSNSLLWEISGNGIHQPSYLFGTFHMMCKDDINFSPNLIAALNISEEVYFEMDLDDAANTLGALFFMNMKEGKILKDFYTEAEYHKLELYFKDSLRTSIATFQKMKPTFLEAFLYPKMMPCKNMSGVEQELLKLALKDKKEIKGFETIAFQSSVFDSIPYSEQAKDLLTTIDSMSKYKVYFDSLVHLYQSQQLDKIELKFNEPEFGLKGGTELLLDNRNINWVAQLKPILKTKNIFIAVGAGHLVGKKGVIELLKKEGYTLRPLYNK